MQTNGCNKRINQTIEIILYFFIYGLANFSMWPIALLAIQLIINNIFLSTISKTPNKITYDFIPCRLLDLFSVLLSLTIPTTRIEAANAIFFAIANQKTHYD